MIPPFTAAGFLPSGIHTATLEEVEDRFVRIPGTPGRARIFYQIRALCETCHKSAFVKRILLAGSFVSVKAEPNDFDCILVLDPKVSHSELIPVEYNLASRRRVRRQFGGDIFPLVEGTDACRKMIRFFQRNKAEPDIGIVEIQL